MNRILLALSAALAITSRRFFAADRGGDTAAQPRVNQPPRPPVITGDPEAQKRRQDRAVQQTHAAQLQRLNADRAANGLPPVDEVPGFFADDAPRDFEPHTIPTGFNAQGPGRPVGTGGELGTSNERASVGKVPVGSSDVAVAEIERSVAQDQPVDGGRGTVPSGELQKSAPMLDPITGTDVITGAQVGEPVGDGTAGGVKSGARPAGSTSTGSTAGTGSTSTRTTGDSDEGATARPKGQETAAELEEANSHDDLQELARKEGVAVSGTKAEIAQRIVEARKAK